MNKIKYAQIAIDHINQNLAMTPDIIEFLCSQASSFKYAGTAFRAIRSGVFFDLNHPNISWSENISGARYSQYSMWSNPKFDIYQSRVSGFNLGLFIRHLSEDHKIYQKMKKMTSSGLTHAMNEFEILALDFDRDYVIKVGCNDSV